MSFDSIDSLIDAFDSCEYMTQEDEYFEDSNSTAESSGNERVDCHETIKTCRGIKICEIADMNLVKTPYYNINPDLDLNFHDNNNLLNEENQIKTNTIGNQDENILNEDYIIQKESSRGDVEIMKPFIGCNRWQPGQKNHRVQKIRPGCNIELLKDLFDNNGIITSYEDDSACRTIISASSTKTHKHIYQNKATKLKLKRLECEVKFIQYEPHDLKACLFIILYYKEVHKHYLPLPGKTPLHIQLTLKKLIEQEIERSTDISIKNICSDWISFYKTPWILASLTEAYTKMPINLWNSTLFDTNIAESVHASVNREGTKLKLRTAIIKIGIHNQFSIPKTHKDTSITQRKYNANKRKARTRIGSKNIEELSSNYAEGSKSVLERELALKERELDISIKEREVEIE
ncbi:12595_t:CDS:2 [Dentiscutata heterogama]|uniref:12595_t:CDS:1 n=1 Tax=Dentiscutata heterogama TaxID=1316150 RepID=A0ACA9KXZ1_9GLOM|nr:12595_t:CDS:2 [Dentiscutata heterogama]